MNTKILLPIKLVLYWFFTISGVAVLDAQGCSDAGLCTIGSLKPISDNPLRTYGNELNAGLSVGMADYGITVFGSAIGYTRKFGETWSVDTKITFLSQQGNDIAVLGPGDIFVNINYKISQKITLTGGMKIPLTKANKSYEDIALPMDYQSSLGTLDFLAGIRYTPGKWQWALAMQLPLTQNENAFFPGLYAPESPLHDIQATNAFVRQADILLRVSRSFEMSDKVTFSPGLLPIYHVSEDEYTDIDGITQSIPGSDGLTLNGTVFVEVELGTTGSLEFNLGFPFIVREVRPDGLTRSLVFGGGYAVRF